MKIQRISFINRLTLFLSFSVIPFSTLAIIGSAEANESPTPTVTPRSAEWKKLPKQSWELSFEFPDNPLPLRGMDGNAVKSKTSLGFEPTLYPSAEKLPALGRIIGSNSDSTFLSLYDSVYIEADKSLQVDSIYTMTSDPETLKSPKSGRKTYSYVITGKVKIIGLRDKLYLGQIVANSDLVTRGGIITSLLPKVPELVPIASPKALEAVLMIDHRFSTYETAQNKEVYFDRGSEDGLKPGMVFRAYQYFDPVNRKKITDVSVGILADIIVTQVSQKFSTGLVLHSRNGVSEKTKVVLLTDVSDLKKYPTFELKKTEEDLDNLDDLDDGLKIRDEEKKKLKQLSKWKKNPSTDSSTTNPPQPGPGTPAGAAPLDTPFPNESETTKDPKNAGVPAPSGIPVPEPKSSPVPSTGSNTPKEQPDLLLSEPDPHTLNTAPNGSAAPDLTASAPEPGPNGFTSSPEPSSAGGSQSSPDDPLLDVSPASTSPPVPIPMSP